MKTLASLVADPLFALSPLTLLAAVALAGGLYLFVRGFRLLARKRMIINTPSSKIRSASLGLVEVNGLATGPNSIPAPITGGQCFLYRTTAWQRSDNSKSEWKKVAEETLHVPFFVDDSTGQLLVEPMGAELDLHCDFNQIFSDTILSPHATPPVLRFLARHHIEPSSRIRIEECSIQPKMPLFVMGTLAENPGVEVRPLPVPAATHGLNGPPAPSAPPPEVVRLSEPAATASAGDMTQQAKIAAALNRAGITSPAAWKAAGVPYQEPDGLPRLEEVAINRPAEPATSPFHLHPPVVLMKGCNNETFLISWRSQREVVGAMSWRSTGMIWGGAGVTLLGLYILLLQFQLL